MATRASSCVALILSPILASGCIFGGGGDKKPQAVSAAPVDSQGGAPVLVPQGSPPSMPSQSQYAAQPRAPKKATPPAVIPQADEVLWPDPSDLQLGEAEQVAAEPTHDRPDPFARRPLETSRELSATEDPSDHLEVGSTAENTRPASPAGEVVANEPMEVGSEPVQAAAEIAAAPAAASIANSAPAPKAGKSVDSGELGARIARNLRESPGDLAANLDNQIMRFLADEPAPDLNSIAGLASEDQAVIVALIDGLTNFRNGLKSEQNPLLSQKIRPLLDLSTRLRTQAELTIPTIALCDAVKGFGKYEPIEARFIGGRPNETIVYCEVGNVSSQQNDKGIWESKLMQEAVLYKENGQRVWSNPQHPVDDRTRNRRNDFYVAQKLLLPANLSTDRYILKVTVTDVQVQRVAEATMPIEIVASMTPQQPLPFTKPAVTRTPTEAPSDAARPASHRESAPNPRGTGELTPRDRNK